MRSSGDQTSVLMLTARHSVSDRVAGLDAGADDYLVKPFALDELFARVRALGRRRDGGAAHHEAQHARTVAYAGVSLDSRTHRREVLEVGCGRGGGGAYVAEHFRVSRLTGLDFSGAAIRFARAHHADPRLRFVRGDAENLPFPDAWFDAVLNVESSHCYPDVPRFTSEVARVLRPGGQSCSRICV